MAGPKVSIVIPYYRQAAFLEDCLGSLKAQTFRDWEAIVVDDASPDVSAESIVQPGSDPRIRCIRHSANRGLAAARNTGFTAAAAELVMPLDADDTLEPDAIEEMVAELEDDPALDCVFSDFQLFGAREEIWRFSVKELSAFTREQWIPGAGMLMRKELWKRAGGYCEDDALRGGNEDWDFWISAAERGFRAAHIPRPLYRYRQHQVSMALTLRRSDYETRRFIASRHRPFFERCGGDACFIADGYWRAADASRKCGRTWLALRRAWQAWRLDRNARRHFSAVCECLKQLTPPGVLERKRAIGAVWRKFMNAAMGQLGVGVGKIAARVSPPKSHLFFLFPCYELGGAEKVHAAIVSVFRSEAPQVFFTQSSANDHFKPLFSETRMMELQRWTRSEGVRTLAIHAVATYINSHARPVAFGGNSPFFYDMLPELGRHVRAVDILHAFGGGMEGFSLPVASRLDARIVITGKVREDLAAQYARAGLESALLDRLVVIPNFVEVPMVLPSKPRKDRLRALYVGRGSAEKRTHLIGAIARKCAEQNLPVDFTVVGGVEGTLSPREQRLCTLAGNVTDPGVLQLHYDNSDVLLLVSSREGFPLVVMEAMAHGAVPICTAVGGIPHEITNGVNGFLVPDLGDERGIVNAFVAILSALTQDRRRLEQLAQAARNHAEEHFSGEDFAREYRNVLGEAT